VTPSWRRPALLALAVVLAACATDPSPTPSEAASAPPLPSGRAASSTPSSPSAEASPSPTPAPELTLELPDSRDERQVSVTVTPTVTADDGEILVSVSSATETRVDDLVVRWPEELGEHLFLAPFLPSEERIRDGGDPLVQPWTKWVVGPGEHGEPAGTISLGYGPLFPGESIDVRIFVTRITSDPVAFDLQVLAANDLLTLADGSPAELRVEIP
jgi:hypothetical protein